MKEGTETPFIGGYLVVEVRTFPTLTTLGYR